MSRPGWQKFDEHHWVNQEGWEIEHCGHPTANWPYIARGPWEDEILLAPSGLGFQRLRQAQDAVDLHLHNRYAVLSSHRPQPGAFPARLCGDSTPWTSDDNWFELCVGCRVSYYQSEVGRAFLRCDACLDIETTWGGHGVWLNLAAPKVRSTHRAHELPQQSRAAW